MNMPVDGPAAGLAAGPSGRPEAARAEDAEDGDPSAVHLRELALFLSVHLDRAPGVLWPEDVHPLLDGLPDGDDAADAVRADRLELLASGLAELTGLATRAVAGGVGTGGDEGEGGDGDGTGGASVPPGHLLVHQIAGAAVWSLAEGREGGGPCASLRYRLRSGEVLYVPDGWSRRAEPTSGARCTVLVLGSTPPSPAGV
ncbi:hypothetical protein [Streptomyces tropicalis]|uniref:Uncharacterized protein n=1 Tax=Streptomyces tropicalis TaxID=3034234 RepID=A0ABT6A4V3_9ACTN|nr:hypothetical protein [Streptomyces tropicalis]MDF3299493.1 hypothetical protein [Streptomyces tropicalis]